ncbi:hypothetical protein L7F22_004898 [Adiantum nelumboides]|nr:hypothetical protein [Adiantum nelumboides]
MEVRYGAKRSVEPGNILVDTSDHVIGDGATKGQDQAKMDENEGPPLKEQASPFSSCLGQLGAAATSRASFSSASKGQEPFGSAVPHRFYLLAAAAHGPGLHALLAPQDSSSEPAPANGHDRPSPFLAVTGWTEPCIAAAARPLVFL